MFDLCAIRIAKSLEVFGSVSCVYRTLLEYHTIQENVIGVNSECYERFIAATTM